MVKFGLLVTHRQSRSYNTNNGKTYKQIRKLLLATFLSAFFVQQIYSQKFSRIYTESRPLLLFSSLERIDESIYLTGLTAAIDSPHYLKAVFARFDDDGNVDYLNGIVDTLPYSYTLWSNNLKRSVGGGLIACGEMIDTSGKIFIAKFDTSGNVLFFKNYTDTNLQIFQAQDLVELGSEGYLIVVNAGFNNGNSEVMVIRTDASGVILNKQVYGAGLLEAPWLIKPMLNKNYMVGAGSISSSGSINKTWLIEIDSMGNYVNQWIDTDNKNLWPYGMQQTADSGWIIVRQHLAYDVSGFQAYNASILKLDKNYTKEWEIDTGDASQECGMYDVEILPDGKYIVCGTKPISGNDSAYRFGWIMKLDTDGTILWDKTYIAYERFGTHSYLYDIDILPNGDLLACGELKFTFNVGITPIQQGWILRTDSNGCVVENCLVGLEEPRNENQEPRQIQVYPNPASRSVQLEVSSEMVGGEVKVYDVHGRVVKEWRVASEKWKVDVSDWGKGLYVVTAEKEGKFARGKLVVE